MPRSTFSRLLVTLAFMAPMVFAQTATAQLGPYGYYGYGGWGAYAYGASVSRANQLGNVAAQRQRQAQSRAMQQNLVVQQGIRSTVGGAAQARTQAMRSEQQSARDWWFQHQLQASRTPRPPVSGAAPVRSVTAAQPGVPSASSPSGDEPGGEIIRWPALLKDPRFDEQRARVEAPFRDRAPDASPTAEDYREIIDAVVRMRVILKTMARTIPPLDYQEAANFLENLEAEARQRARREAAARTGEGAAERPAAPGNRGG